MAIISPSTICAMGRARCRARPGECELCALELCALIEELARGDGRPPVSGRQATGARGVGTGKVRFAAGRTGDAGRMRILISQDQMRIEQYTRGESRCLGLPR